MSCQGLSDIIRQSSDIRPNRLHGGSTTRQSAGCPPPPPRPAADPLRPAWQRTPPDWWRHLDSSICTELNKTSSGQRSICPSPIRRRAALIENNTAMHCHFAQGLLAIRVRQIHGPALRCPTVSPLTLSDDITCPCSCPSPPDPKRHCPIYLPKPPRPARP